MSLALKNLTIKLRKDLCEDIETDVNLSFNFSFSEEAVNIIKGAKKRCLYFAGEDSHIEKNDIETEEVEQDENEQLSDNEETEEAEYNENEDEPSSPTQ